MKPSIIHETAEGWDVLTQNRAEDWSPIDASFNRLGYDTKDFQSLLFQEYGPIPAVWGQLLREFAEWQQQRQESAPESLSSEDGLWAFLQTTGRGHATLEGAGGSLVWVDTPKLRDELVRLWGATCPSPITADILYEAYLGPAVNLAPSADLYKTGPDAVPIAKLSKDLGLSLTNFYPQGVPARVAALCLNAVAILRPHLHAEVLAQELRTFWSAEEADLRAFYDWMSPSAASLPATLPEITPSRRGFFSRLGWRKKLPAPLPVATVAPAWKVDKLTLVPCNKHNQLWQGMWDWHDASSRDAQVLASAKNNFDQRLAELSKQVVAVRTNYDEAKETAPIRRPPDEAPADEEPEFAHEPPPPPPKRGFATLWDRLLCGMGMRQKPEPASLPTPKRIRRRTQPIEFLPTDQTQATQPVPAIDHTIVQNNINQANKLAEECNTLASGIERLFPATAS